MLKVKVSLTGHWHFDGMIREGGDRPVTIPSDDSFNARRDGDGTRIAVYTLTPTIIVDYLLRPAMKKCVRIYIGISSYQ